MLSFMYRNFKVQTLGTQLKFWVTVLIWISAIFIMVIFSYHEIREAKKQKIAELEQAISMQHSTIERWFGDQEKHVSYISQLHAVRTLNYQGMQSAYQAFLRNNRHLSQIIYINTQGRYVNLSDGALGPDVSDQEFFKKAAEGSSHITDVVQGGLSDQPIIVVSCPVYNLEGKFIGVVAGFVRLTILDEIMAQFTLGQTGESYLINRDGYMLTEPRFLPGFVQTKEFEKFSSLQMKIDTEGYRNAIWGISGAAAYLDYRGKKVVGAYRWMDCHNWIIIGEIEEKEILQPVYKELEGLFFGFLLILSGGWFLTIHMTKYIKSPIDRLSQSTRLMQEGNYQAKIETGQLAGTLVEGSPLGVVIIQGDEFVYTNPRIAVMLGYTQVEFSARKAFIDDVFPDDRPQVLENQRKKVEGEVTYTSYQIRVLNKEGAILFAEVYSTTCMYQGKTSIIATLLDVTEKQKTKLALQQNYDELELRVKQRTAELQKSYCALEAEIRERKKAEEVLQRYQLLVEQAHDIILMIDIDSFHIIDANEAAVSSYGYSREELLARRIQELLGPGATPLAKEHLQQLMEKGLLFESVHRRRDGSCFPVDVSIFVGILRGQRVGMSIIRDITERKQAERTMFDAREHIARTERLASLGTMAAGIAHEINQPLNSIKVTADSLLYWHKKGKKHKFDDIVDDIEGLSVQAGRIDKIIKHLRAMVYGQNITYQCINLNSAVEGALDLIQSQLDRHGIKITKLLDPALPQVRGDLTQLEGVVLNLAVNAMQSLGARERTDKEIILKTYFDDHVILEVSDNGMGIDDATREKIFIPFFTTKPVGEGMGMGLSIVHSVVASYNGEIHVSNNDFGGATFQVKIPKA